MLYFKTKSITILGTCSNAKLYNFCLNKNKIKCNIKNYLRKSINQLNMAHLIKRKLKTKLRRTMMNKIYLDLNVRSKKQETLLDDTEWE